MPTHFFPLTILTQEFEDEAYLAEALNFYEVSRFHTNRETAIFNTRLNAEQTLKDVYANFLHTRIAPENIEIREIFVEVAPPKKSELWRENISLKFHALCSTREDGYSQAFIPAFKIEVLTKKANDLESKIKKEILSALRRDGWTKSLQYLRRLERIKNVTIHREELAVTLPTARQRAVAEEKGRTDCRPVASGRESCSQQSCLGGERRAAIRDAKSAAPARRISKPGILSGTGDASFHVRQAARHPVRGGISPTHRPPTRLPRRSDRTFQITQCRGSARRPAIHRQTDW